MMTSALYAGSFDPITKGHLDIIQRALNTFDTVIVGIGVNSSKRYAFAAQERCNMALDAIREVAPGGHHLGTEHTRRHFRTAFYRAELMDYGTAEQWNALGAKDAYQRANEKVKQLLASYQPPELEAAIEEALRDFMARRKSQA